MKKENKALKGRILTKITSTFLGVILITAFILTGCSKDDDGKTLSEANQITSFQFSARDNTVLAADIAGVINETGKTITVVVPSGTTVTGLTPEIGVSTGATVSPEGTQNFTNSVIYTVTAENGTESNYEVNVEITASEANEITSFAFLATDNVVLTADVLGIIDETAKTIMVVVPTGTVVTGLTSETGISPNATISPEGAQNFTNSVTYTVTAENGTSIDYEISISTQGEVEREALTAIYEANPGNTLGWDLADPDVNNWDGVTTNADGNVVELDIGNTINLPNIPAEIGNLINLERLYIDNMGVTSLPAEIGQLTNLTYLNLYDIALTSLPIEIGQLTNLTYLNISSNNNLDSIPSEIGNLTNLVELHLYHNALISFPVELVQITSLRILSLRDNNITSIPLEVSTMGYLDILNIEENDLINIPQPVCDLEALYGVNLIFDVGVTCISL